MRKYVPRWLNDAALAEMDGGEFVGVIEAVAEETLHNRYARKSEMQPVVSLSDGWRWVPNLTARQTLIAALGPETDAWIGRRVRIAREPRQHRERVTGEVRVRWQKVVTVEPAIVVSMPVRPDRAAYADYDDSDAALADAGGSVDDMPTADEIFGERRRSRG